MIGLGEDAPLDLAGLAEQVDALARAARPLIGPRSAEPLLSIPWAEAPDRLRDLAAHDAVGSVRVRVVPVCGALHVEIAAYGHHPRAALATPTGLDDACPGTHLGGGWDYYPGD